MPQFWWVNHNQTARQEIEGQYLWSPKTESSGARSQFYNNMRRATPGDYVLSYADQRVQYVGRVVEFAFTAPKPEEFGETGAYWSQEGWLLPVYWTPLAPIVSPRTMINVLGPLLPDRYSPINPVTGYGNQKAYLAAIPEGVFEAVVAASKFDAEALVRGGANRLTFEVVTSLLDDAVERRIQQDPDLDATTKHSLVLARRGQGRFRAAVQRVEPACRLTGITNPSLLTASHIKPWRACASSDERLDGMNGLMLTPDADLLFDRGFISFDDSGAVLISTRVDRSDLRRLGFERLAQERFGTAVVPEEWQTGAFVAAQQVYLAHHRSDVFVC